MSEELQQKFIGWIETLARGAQAELPSFLEEVVSYGFMDHIFIISCMILIMAVTVFSFTLIYKYMPKPAESWNVSLGARRAFTIAIGAGLCMVYTIVIIDQGRSAIKARYAPRVYVIDKYLLKK